MHRTQSTQEDKPICSGEQPSAEAGPPQADPHQHHESDASDQDQLKSQGREAVRRSNPTRSVPIQAPWRKPVPAEPADGSLLDSATSRPHLQQ